MTKTFAACVVLLFLTLAVVSFVPSEPARAEAANYFSEAVIERGLHYTVQRRLLFWGATATELGMLLLLGLTGAGRRLADGCARLCRGWWLPTLLLVGAAVYLLVELTQFPFAVARLYHARSWGVTNRAFAPWLGEFLLGQAVALAIGAVPLAGIYLLMRGLPRIWWLLATLGAGVFAAAVAFVMPLLIAPLFNTFTPIAETPWAGLEPRIRALTDEAGVPVAGVYVMDASRQGKHTNAYFTGFGTSRRIVLYDTLLKSHPPAEVESILGHELGHWTHQHIVKGILLGMAAAAVGLFLLDRILRWARGRAPWQLTSPADPAGLPLVALLMVLGSWVALPLENAVSRSFERQADAEALQLAGQPEAFKRAEVRLVEDNLSNPAPAPWNVWLFATHPPAVERIRMAEQWEAAPQGRRIRP